MESKNFFDSFVTGITDNGNYVKCDESITKFTRNVSEVIKNIFGDRYYAEWLTVDFTEQIVNKSDETEEAKKHGFNKWYWYIETLVEHENDSSDWNYEVCKLAQMKARLRVVIGYSEVNDRNSTSSKNDVNRLNYVSEILRKLKDVGAFCEDGEFMIIIGNLGWDKANYSGYIYNNGKFEYRYGHKFDNE